MKYIIINGPNLNMLGSREPEIYGKESLVEIEHYTQQKTKNLKIEIDWYQSNSEVEIIEIIHKASKEKKHKGLIINPGAFSHTSVAIVDALKVLNIPIVEVHLSNTNSRESFRLSKLTAKAATIIMEGLGKDVYHVALYALVNQRKK